MWNPLASLPASNVGALSAYAQPQQPLPPVAPTGLHPLYRGAQGGMGGDQNMVHAMGNNDAFKTAMEAWKGQMPGRPEMGNFGGMAPGGAQGAWQDWRSSVFAPWRQSVMDWRQDRPMRSDF